MCRCIKRVICIAVLFTGIGLLSCGRAKKHTYSYHAGGYYYHLLAFSSDTFSYRPDHIVHLAASFKTQADSVFWDSYNNLNDNFFTDVDSAARDNFIKQYSSGCSAGDSASLLIRASDFFRQQFKSDKVPYFCKNDSVVKVDLKVKRILNPVEFAAIILNLRVKEQAQINDYIERCCDNTVHEDPLGFYWLSKQAGQEGGAGLKPGAVIRLSYRGTFLNGRFLEASPAGFEYIYGTPEQLLKGLNYVIGRIKIGQNAKIILPSRLAFGENGSTNGTVPPFTPLLYEIKITEVKE